MTRWVMHVDMDAFFASVEQLDHLEYRNKPLIVGGCSKRGVVSTCSYEARKFGVHSAMPIAEAKRLCPQGIFVPGRMWRYAEMSEKIMHIFDEYSPLVEPLSIDEAFLDLSGMDRLVEDMPKLGSEIKERIKSVTGLTASVGIAPNKFLAKFASDLKKPDGLVVIRQEEAETFLAPYPIEKMFGIGKRAAEELHKLGITKIGDIAKCNEEYLKHALGSNAEFVKCLAKGLDDRPVENYREAKSIGKETTFLEDLKGKEVCRQKLLDLSQQVGWRLRNSKLCGHTITLKVKYNDFRVNTRSITTEAPISFDEDIFVLVVKLMDKVNWSIPIRLLGVAISKLELEGEPILSLVVDEKLEKRNQVLDAIKNKFGEDIIKRGK